MDERFRKLIKVVLKNECGNGNGYVNDKDDAGGVTVYGITRRNHPDLIIWKSLDDISTVRERKRYKPSKEEMDEVYDITKLINGCIETAEFALQMKFDQNSESYKSFVDYLKYVSLRLLRRKALPEGLDQDKAFVKMMKKYCKARYLCAGKIQEYILKTFQIDISEDVVLTLTIYLKRLSSNSN